MLYIYIRNTKIFSMFIYFHVTHIDEFLAWIDIFNKYFADDNPQMESNSFLKTEADLEEYNIRNGICNIDKEIESQDSTRFKDDKHENFLNDTSDRSTCLSEQISKPKFMLHRLLFNRINFILLAGIVNILLMLKLDNYFGQVILFNNLLKYLCS